MRLTSFLGIIRVIGGKCFIHSPPSLADKVVVPIGRGPSHSLPRASHILEGGRPITVVRGLLKSKGFADLLPPGKSMCGGADLMTITS